jgi:hypothetical protein
MSAESAIGATDHSAGGLPSRGEPVGQRGKLKGLSYGSWELGPRCWFGRLSAGTATTRAAPPRYQVILTGVWRLWREARLVAVPRRVFAGGGRTIEGGWQGSAGGSRWKHDLGLDYPRRG